MKKKAIAILVASTLIMTSVVGLTGCKNDSDKVDTPVVKKFEGTKIMKQTNGKVKTLNPHTYLQSTESKMFGKVYDGYIEYVFDTKEKKEKLIPVMAKEIPTISDDKLSCTIKLRDNLKFTDGKAIDAETFIYSYKMLLDPKLKNNRAGDYCFSGIYIKNAKEYFEGKCKWEDVGVKAKDKYTLELTFSTAVPVVDTYSSLTSPVVVHPDLYEKGMNKERTETTYGTTLELTPSFGPYRLTEWTFDQSYTLEKNKGISVLEAYFTPDKTEARVVEEASTVLQMFEKGDVDFAGVPKTSLDKYAEDPRLITTDSGGVQQLNINSVSKTNPILKDKNFRQAVFYAIDRASSAKSLRKVDLPATYLLSKNYTLPVDGKGVPFRDTDAGKSVIVKNNGYDPKLAKELFEKAYTANGGKKVTVTMMYYDTAESHKILAEYLKKSFEDTFGADKIDFKLQATPSAAHRQNVKEQKYDMAFSAWVGGNVDNACDKMLVYTSTFGNKTDTFFNKEFDELYNRCMAGDLVFKDKEKAEALAKMEKMIVEDATVIPLYDLKDLTLISDKIVLPTKVETPHAALATWQSDFTR